MAGRHTLSSAVLSFEGASARIMREFYASFGLIFVQAVFVRQSETSKTSD